MTNDKPLKIEAGKSYRTRDGRKVLVRVNKGNSAWPFTDGADEFWADGNHSHCRIVGMSYSHKYCDKGDGADLVAEWHDSPVREVTRKETDPGVYGRLSIKGPDATWPGRPILAALVPHNEPAAYYTPPFFAALNASECRALAATLTLLADALEGGAA